MLDMFNIGKYTSVNVSQLVCRLVDLSLGLSCYLLSPCLFDFTKSLTFPFCLLLHCLVICIIVWLINCFGGLDVKKSFCKLIQCYSMNNILTLLDLTHTRNQPINQPTNQPTNKPTNQPTNQPQPTKQPQKLTPHPPTPGKKLAV